MSIMYAIFDTSEESTTTNRARCSRRTVIIDDPVGPGSLRDSFEVHRKSLAKKRASLRKGWYADEEDTKTKACFLKQGKGTSMLARLFARLREVWRGERGSQPQPYSRPPDFYQLDQQNPWLESDESIYAHFADSDGEDQRSRFIYRRATL